MNTTKIMLVLMILIACAFSANAVQGPELTAEILRYEPSPVEPGSYFELWIGVQNKGTQAQDVKIEFVPEYPFNLATGEDEVKTIKNIPSTEGAVVKYKFVVDVDAPVGDEPINFMFNAATRAPIKLEKTISIKGASVMLTIENYKLAPEKIKPGEKVTAELTLKNNGKVGMKNIDIFLDLPETAKFSTATTGTKQRISMIGPGEEAKVTFDLISDTSTEIKVYQLPISLSYEDFRGNKYSDSAKISIIVSAEPELTAMIDSTLIATPLSSGEVTFKIINKGVVNLKYLNARIIELPEYDILSTSNEAYIGNLDSDDFETVDFTIKPTVTSPRIKLVVEFKDPYNKDYTKEFNLPLRIVSAGELGQTKTPWVPILIGLFVIAVIIYWIYRRRKKAHMQKK